VDLVGVLVLLELLKEHILLRCVFAAVGPVAEIESFVCCLVC